MRLFFLLFCIDYCLSLSVFHLYYTHHRQNPIDHDCLYYFTPQLDSIFAYQFVEYCIRSSLDDEDISNDTDDDRYTFEDFRQMNITSDQLYHWSVPIDLIEDYQIYLETNILRSDDLFYNCTYPWFGRQCEYRFDDPQSDFGEQVDISFSKKDRYDLRDLIVPSCYIDLQCDRIGDQGRTPGACLDWREVCDGKVDCVNGGQDEHLCWQLEFNECDEKTEFRCQNGLCIPLPFLRDDYMNADCLDRSDESLFPKHLPWHPISNTGFPENCHTDPSFRCEDQRCHSSRYRNHTFECGDGSCQNIKSACMNKRNSKLFDGLWLGSNLTDACRRNMMCFTSINVLESLDENCTVSTSTLVKNIARYCPTFIVLPPLLFGHVQFVYRNNQSQKINSSRWENLIPDYICHDDRLCDLELFSTMWSPPTDLLGNNTTCRSLDQLLFVQNKTFEDYADVMTVFYRLFRKCSNYHQPSSVSVSSYSNVYQCINSLKVISHHRLLDGIEDCLHGDDELYGESCSLKNFNHRFRCRSENNTRCVVRSSILDEHPDCLDQSDEKEQFTYDLETTVSFQTLCDGHTELLPTITDGRNETDETECDYFPCNNLYTRCDYFWNCPNGVDEVNCEWPPMCPPLHHMCLSPIFGNLTCLHVTHVNDGIIDCLGASDERDFCRETMKDWPAVRYRCWNSDQCMSSAFACLKPPLCPMNTNNSNPMYFCRDVRLMRTGFCQTSTNFTHAEQLLCTLSDALKMTTKHFSIIESTYSSHQIPTDTVLTGNTMSDDPIIDDLDMVWHCNRGLIVRRRTMVDRNNTKIICLCPPAYSGDLCQYQNQRVSLTMQVRAAFDFRSEFTLVITLRDDQQSSIESHDQINYLYERDCRKKFNIYLLYSTRPKNRSTNHSVHIDIFDKQIPEYRASWLFPIKFPFLPVYRLAIQLQIPPKKLIKQDCHTLDCGTHGRCSFYENTKTLFCICDEGWSGKYCDIPYTNRCSSDSFSFAPNICVCPLQRFGPRCYLRHHTCTCENNGTCILSDERIDEERDRWCICQKGFSGSQCELTDMTLSLSFAPEVPIPRSILVHFIAVSGKSTPHNRSTVPLTIPLDQEMVSISRFIPFHIVFVEVLQPQTYYLSVFQREFLRSVNISSTIKHSNRCLSIDELFNETMLNWHPLRRMKYYHLPCQQQSDLTCFYDENHLCICHSDIREANCMTFDRSMSYECEEDNPCANDGQCFRDKPSCPTSFICKCDECSYGSQCQVSTKGFGLSLDIILAYHIRPHRSFNEQSLIIHMTTGIVLMMFSFGFISSLLSIITFHRKKTREVGCGYYLLISSYISLIIIIILLFKFTFLLASQMALITHQNYLKWNCIILEFLLKVLLSTGDWLNSFVAIERLVAVRKSTKFNKLKAKRIAKWMIVGICIVTTTTHLHDPIYRQMIDDTIDQRSWCHVKFSASLELYNSIILPIHFGVPFLLNIISALMIIIITTRQRSAAQKQQSYQHQLRKQFNELKHLLISPIILIILASPRLVISFLSGCIKTTRENPWLYLSGYLISFLPSMLIVVVFIVPSELYKNEFKRTFTRFQEYIRRDHF